MTTNRMVGNVKYCCYCNSSDGEFRPYGPNGAWCCFDCATSPEHVDETNKNFKAQLQAGGPVVIIGEETGPRPLVDTSSKTLH